MPKWKQPPKQDGDGQVAITYGDIGSDREDYITISCTTNDKLEQITVSEYNASRIFGMIALMLKIPVPKDLNLILSETGKMDMTYKSGAVESSSLGEKVSANIVMQRLNKMNDDYKEDK